MLLTDTHCHLDLERFDSDRAAVLERAGVAGVGRMLVPGLTAASSRSAVRLAHDHAPLFAAVGVHPTEACTWTRTTGDELRALADLPLTTAGKGDAGQGARKVVAIGEIGLDYYWESTPHELQRTVLGAQLELAAGLGLPVVIHLRESGDAQHGPCGREALDDLEAWVASLRASGSPLAQRPGVLHSFSGSDETAARALSLGFYIGISGPVTYRNAGAKQSLVAKLPLERLLVETDAPFLAPHTHRGKRNEPAFVVEIADKIAQLQSRSLEEVAQATSANAARLFSWGEMA